MWYGARAPTRRVNRVNRGGNWNGTARNTRAANRKWNEPTNVNDDIGFRLASSADGRGGRPRMPAASSGPTRPRSGPARREAESDESSQGPAAS